MGRPVMSAELRLGQALGAVVRKRLSAGLGYLRIPEIVSPFPITELLADLRDLTETRYAVFLNDVALPEEDGVTQHVHEAIRWRNDPTIPDNLVIIGDLERDRAAGLASVPTVTANDVRIEL